MASITISNVTGIFGDVVVLREFNEVFHDKEFVTCWAVGLRENNHAAHDCRF